MSSPAIRRGALVAFVVSAFLFGGGARDDISSLVLLRPLAALFAAYALTIAARDDLARVRWPLIGIAALAAWMLVQLIPLPPGWWSALPGRAAIARADVAVGSPDLWRPITLSRTRTINSLASLIVPVATLLLMAVQGEPWRRTAAWLLLAVGVASAALGLAQMTGPPGGPLYLYRVTNEASAVGLFANRNHHGFLLAALVPFCAWAAADGLSEGKAAGRGRAAAAGAAAALFALVAALTGSRGALVLLAATLVAGGALVWPAARRALPSRARPVAAAGLAVVALLAALAAWFGPRLPGLARIMAGGTGEDIRFRALPTLLRMARDHLPVGGGFGSFEYLFRVYEPDALLKPTIFNQAHDDWLQVAIEGGAPGVLIALAGSAWVALTAVRAVAGLRRSAPDAVLTAAAAGALVVLLCASLTDYPLRVPALMTFAAVCAALAADPRRDGG